ncbi:hypothetical protein AAG570_001145 [Ranatra chinensis]|uniref:Uncharacterized protein n=1 Tax=Ranatra chinensis TaxID=642074 RepID=A0ABD0YCW5_9HEMI
MEPPVDERQDSAKRLCGVIEETGQPEEPNPPQAPPEPMTAEEQPASSQETTPGKELAKHTPVIVHTEMVTHVLTYGIVGPHADISCTEHYSLKNRGLMPTFRTSSRFIFRTLPHAQALLSDVD